MPKSSANAASQRDQAYRSLRGLLVLQQLQPGERLREPEWVKRLGVHRTALREAFARLDAEGLIERGPQTGYFVPLLTASDIAEITRLRFTLECLAIEEICGHRKRSLEPLKDAIKQFQQFLAGEYSLGVLEADRRFHEALVDAASMRRLSALSSCAAANASASRGGSSNLERRVPADGARTPGDSRRIAKRRCSCKPRNCSASTSISDRFFRFAGENRSTGGEQSIDRIARRKRWLCAKFGAGQRAGGVGEPHGPGEGHSFGQSHTHRRSERIAGGGGVDNVDLKRGNELRIAFTRNDRAAAAKFEHNAACSQCKQRFADRFCICVSVDV